MPKDNDDDLTRIEDLSEYEHVESSKVNLQLGGANLKPHASPPPPPPPPLPNETVEEKESSPPQHSFAGVEGTESSLSTSFETNQTVETTLEESPPLDEVKEDATPFSLSDDAPFELSTDDFSSQETAPPPPSEDIFSFEDEKTEEEITPFTKEETYTPPTKERETFADIREFGKNFTYGNITLGGNPPFSILIRGVKFSEDADEILRLLSEHDLLKDGQKEIYQRGLSNGSILISQLSEYSAIYLAHKLRRLDIELSIGLSDEIHPKKGVEKEFRGLIHKGRIDTNKIQSANLRREDLKRENIITSTLSILEGLTVERYLGIITATHKIGISDLDSLSSIDSKENQNESYNTYYKILVDELKEKAIKLGGNAIIGINFSLTPIEPSGEYQLSTVGNVVWATDRGLHARD